MEQPTFFPTPADFRAWLHTNHDKEKELWVGYYKKATKLPTMTWSESVDQAICYGWIDGIRKKQDEKSYKIRFTPRRPTSIWSAVNIKKVEALTKAGLMQPAGIAAYEKRKAEKSKVYAFEQDNIVLPAEYEDKIKENQQAWAYFSKLASGYKRQTIWWVISAKQEKTRLRRLQVLIESSEAGLKIPQMRRKKK